METFRDRRLDRLIIVLMLLMLLGSFRSFIGALILFIGLLAFVPIVWFLARFTLALVSFARRRARGWEYEFGLGGNRNLPRRRRVRLNRVELEEWP